MVHWLYRAAFKHRYLHATAVWLPGTHLKTVRAEMNHVHALIFRSIIGAMRTTPTATLGALLCKEPSFIAAMAKAVLTAKRLMLSGQ